MPSTTKGSSGSRRANASQLRLAFADGRTGPREAVACVRCTWCGKNFSLPRWYKEQGLSLQFCCADCRASWQQDPTGSVKLLKLGGRPNRRGGNWRAQSDRARKRDGYRCQVCGATEEALGRRLDVHHRVPARTYNDASKSNRLSNLVSVCPSCHKGLERRGLLELPLFGGVRHPGQRSEPPGGA